MPVGCALKQERAELDAARGAQAAQIQAANSARKQEVAAGREGARKAQVGHVCMGGAWGRGKQGSQSRCVCVYRVPDTKRQSSSSQRLCRVAAKAVFVSSAERRHSRKLRLCTTHWHHRNPSNSYPPSGRWRRRLQFVVAAAVCNGGEAKGRGYTHKTNSNAPLLNAGMLLCVLAEKRVTGAENQHK